MNVVMCQPNSSFRTKAVIPQVLVGSQLRSSPAKGSWPYQSHPPYQVAGCISCGEVVYEGPTPPSQGRTTLQYHPECFLRLVGAFVVIAWQFNFFLGSALSPPTSYSFCSWKYSLNKPPANKSKSFRVCFLGNLTCHRWYQKRPEKADFSQLAMTTPPLLGDKTLIAFGMYLPFNC